MRQPLVHQFVAKIGDTVVVQWVALDGKTYIERYTAPPRPVRDARTPKKDE